MNNTVSGKTIEIMRKHRDTKFVTTEKKRNYSVPEPNCHTKSISQKMYQQ